ncbi:orotidine-5'-phosphate decarboxylase [Candidatus Uhrbacteria bacterium]|nr:MAG: orotidine-5'-phosphate decarboxylase [Candidatus Uhrbacteria bacterium]
MQMLEAKWAEGKFVCVGLDPVLEKLPKSVTIPTHLRSRDIDERTATIAAFNIAIVDMTKDLVCAYKPNAAFYEAYGAAGIEALAWTLYHIRHYAPDVPVIYDAKRADIGNTNAGYAKSAFDDLQADAITVHPYLGAEAMKPFLDRADKGVIVLCRTSNPGAGEFQDMLTTRDGPLYVYVARQVARAWNTKGNCAVVVGATYPSELAEVRRIVGDMPILIPGIGAQGGDLEAAVKAGRDSQGRGMIINSSRGILYASSGEDFAEAARRETQKLHDQITACLTA